MNQNEKITIYEPNQRVKTGLIKTWILLVRNIIDSWELIYQLWRRDFLMSHKKSFLGMGWLLISPIMGIISWVLMNSTGILKPGDVGIPYPAYVLLSTTLWGLFMGFFSASSGTLSAGSSFIMQVSFSHDALLVKQALQQLSGFVITFVITLGVLIAFGVFPKWQIVLIPIFILPMFFFASALGLMVAIIRVVTPDFNKIIGYGMSFLMYITPIIYSPKIDHPILQVIIRYNPLTYLVGGVRDAIIYGHIENMRFYFYSVLLSLIMFLFSWRLFYIGEEKVIEKMI